MLLFLGAIICILIGLFFYYAGEFGPAVILILIGAFLFCSGVTLENNNAMTVKENEIAEYVAREFEYEDKYGSIYHVYDLKPDVAINPEHWTSGKYGYYHHINFGFYNTNNIENNRISTFDYDSYKYIFIYHSSQEMDNEDFKKWCKEQNIRIKLHLSDNYSIKYTKINDEGKYPFEVEQLQ